MPSLVIASEIRLFREGLAELLSRSDSLSVVAMATDCNEAARLTREHSPDVVLLDQALPGSLMLVRTLLRPLADITSQVRVVVIGVPDADDSVLAFAEAGVAGYLPREGSVEDLVLAIEGAVRGELHCSPQLAGTIARRLAWRAASLPDQSNILLTARELDVVRLITDGRSNKEIATALGIEVATVKNHVHNLLEKLNVRRRAEVAARLGAR
ncbi:MAG TPA: response regulator transcription factor [Gemmatimonadaceae bacterium]|nr:response regulator transcription factor [Gemmatimonadaceae bacterium]